MRTLSAAQTATSTTHRVTHEIARSHATSVRKCTNFDGVSCEDTHARGRKDGWVPQRSDLNHVLVIGSGPIVIGQACEFDYSGTQACRIMRAEGLQVSLVNSNPATIMTDPEFADHTYVEPITPAFVERVIAQQAERGNKIDALAGHARRPDRAQHSGSAVRERRRWERYGVELIGADFEAIQRGEDRQRFKDIVAKVGGESAAAGCVSPWTRSARRSPTSACPWWCGLASRWAASAPAWPILREDVDRMAGDGLAASPCANVLIEESIYGWKEFELELMRDRHDNVVWSARSRTSTPWACTPVTRSRSPPR